MTPERWREVQQIFADVLEQNPADRAAYLTKSCADASLRHEVELMIAAHEQQDSGFLEPPIAGGNEVLQSGAKLGPYEILAPEGVGGMGVVYKARDTKLGRQLALKLLPEGVLADKTARARFLREAQNASALNHPNIATIYEVGEDAGQVYIAMELVEGQPLSALIKRDGLSLETVVRYGLEISGALTHSHERGIVHRDLKLANVVITVDGHAKVLDFGLAKRLSSGPLDEGAPSQDSLAQEGAIAGTLQYMAPEALRGEFVDARTDIWALGVVLYEMAAGTPPFQGRTPYELTSAILSEPPGTLPTGVPASLQSVIQRCLAKKPAQRYQQASEVRTALEGIAAALPTAVHASAPRWRLNLMSIGVGLLALLLLGAGVVGWFRATRTGPPAASQENWVQITDFADSAVSPAFSPDGHILAFIRGQDTFMGFGQVYVKLLPNGDPVRLTHDSLIKFGPQFSPDGSTIAYTVFALNDFNTWVVPVLGGEPRLMFPNTEGLTWIDPDHLLFSEIVSGIHMAVVTSDSTRDRIREVYVPPRERGMAHRSALSPDHKWVLLAEMDNGGWLPCRLVPFDGSSAGKEVGPQGAACTYVAWSPDESWMYFSSDAGGHFHTWRQRFPDGEIQQVTSGPTEEEGIAVAPDGASLITSVGLTESTLWVRDAKGERQISSEGYAESPEFSHDGGRLYYLVRRQDVSGESSSAELWMADLETGHSERLLPGTLVSDYDVSRDGTSVVFSATDAQDRSRLFLASLNPGFPPRQFVSHANEDKPHFDSAGNIYFRAAEGRFNFLYRMKQDGNERVRLLSDPILDVQAVSPDGRWAIVAQAKGEGPTARILASPLDGGVPVMVCPGYCLAQWTPDGKNFSIIADTMAGTVTFVAPVSPAKGLPLLPSTGIVSRADMERVIGAKAVPGAVLWGPKPGLSASLHQDIHRNLYRVALH